MAHAEHARRRDARELEMQALGVGERALGADQQVGEDVERALVVEQGVQAVPDGVLHPVLAPHPLGELRPREEVAPERQQSLRQRRLRGPEPLLRAGGGGVHQGPRGEQEGDGLEGVVGVLLHAAAHPARVVRQDPAEGAGVDAGGVGADPPAVPGEDPVHLAADHPGLHPHQPPVLLHGHVPPEPAHLHQHAVGHRLAAEAGPPGAEGERHPVARGDREEGPHLVHVAGQHHGEGHQPVAGGVGGPGDPVEGPDQQPPGVGDGPAQVGEEGGRHRGVGGHRRNIVPAPGERQCPPP